MMEPYFLRLTGWLRQHHINRPLANAQPDSLDIEQSMLVLLIEPLSDVAAVDARHTILAAHIELGA